MRLVTFKRGEYQVAYDKLSDEDKTILDNYGKKCLEGCSESKAVDMQRNVLKFKLSIGKSFKDIDLEDTKEFMDVLKNSKKISDSAKNDSIVHVIKHLKILHKDWSEKFDNFDSKLFKQVKNPKNKRPINEDVVLSKEDIKKLLTTENRTFWKAFLMVQYEGALRTKEVRELTWKDLKEDGDYYSFNLYSTKTEKEKPVVLKEAKKWIDKLRDEQINTKSKGKYIFHSVRDVDKPIPKYNVSIWMRGLSKKALGKEIWCYVLRHTRGTELKKLIKENKLSKDNALEMMGHSEKMFDKIYSHVDKETIRDMIKEQLYNFDDLPEEQKPEVFKRMEVVEKRLDSIEEALKKL